MATYDLTTITTSMTNLCTAINGTNGFTISGNSGTYSGEASTTHTKYANNAFKLTAAADVAECYGISTITPTLNPEHIYYFRVEAYQETASGSVDLYWPIAEPNAFSLPIKPAGQWNIYSEVRGRASFEAGDYKYRLDFNASNKVGSIWFDGLMIIDLTSAFGAGNEPTKDWCDNNIPYFEGTIQFMKSVNLKKGDIINIPYSGSAKAICLPAGKFKLECWGAQGGYRSSATYGGKGGYSTGNLTLIEPTVLHAYAGGFPGSGTTNAGSSVIRPGGFNGGGDRYGYYGGGGGSDFRIIYDSLYSRIVVAGGGGSDGATAKTGMHGGGTSGGSASQNYGTGGGGGTQTAGGSGGSSNAGTFGQGGTGLFRSSGYAGAGGGGWYGGGGSYPDGSGDDDRGGGGGSGYVFTSANASNYPSGCLLNEKYYLSSGSTTAGNVSFTDYDGTTVTGHSGNGACRITVNSIEGQIDGEILKSTQSLDFLRVGDLLVKKAYLGNNQIFPGLLKELVVTRAVLDEGAFVNVTPTYLTGQQNNSDGFTIVGRNATASGSATYAGDLKWEYDIDLTGINIVRFYCKKGANHGICKICVDGAQKLWVHYNDLPTSWTQYSVDLTEYTGVHKIGFVGGYTDATGNTSSSTSYCDIRFTNS